MSPCTPGTQNTRPNTKFRLPSPCSAGSPCKSGDGTRLPPSHVTQTPWAGVTKPPPNQREHHMGEPLSLRVDQIAEATGISERVVWDPIRTQQLVPRYTTSRPVVLVVEVKAWLHSPPPESPRRRASRTRTRSTTT